jgi:hypothetical protein
MERLLATINANQAKSDAARKDDKEQMLAKMDANQAKVDAHQAKMEANMGSMRDALKCAIRELRFSREEMMACEEKTEIRLEDVEEPASVDVTPEVTNEEVPVQDAERMPVGEPRKKRRDRRRLAAERRQNRKDQNLDARRRRKKQGRAQRNHGCLKNSVAARRGTTCRAVVARQRTFFMETTQSRRIVVCKWHDATIYRERTQPERIWPQPAGRRPALRK